MPSIKPIKTLAQAEALLAEIGRQQHELMTLDAVEMSRVTRIKTELDKTRQPIKAFIEQGQQQLQIWADTHWEQVLPGKKTHDSYAGKMGWRTSSSVVIDNPEKVLARLLKQGAIAFIRTTYAINKQAILANPREAEKTKGINISIESTFYLKPAIAKDEDQ